ncbi:hypothetical protein DAEQUDRAFT_384714 [Daedalea quercina L-15889]|uniref:Uncharacterized protein n=1 Tax=Daedalea quercina L-15889 TaxID=1314783 RepID=A0A165P1K5_9APHY|nr:hypothetical protein DAEQUDRAFT_384714 [Daedalea quercina L-15889]
MFLDDAGAMDYLPTSHWFIPSESFTMGEQFANSSSLLSVTPTVRLPKPPASPPSVCSLPCTLGSLILPR